MSTLKDLYQIEQVPTSNNLKKKRKKTMKKLKTFTCSYNFEGSKWSFEIPAADFDDAQYRLRSIAGNGKVDGEIVVSIPIPLFERLSIFNKIFQYFTRNKQLKG